LKVQNEINGNFNKYVASFPFDLVHAVTNTVLLVLFYSLFERILKRAKDKFINSAESKSSLTSQ